MSTTIQQMVLPRLERTHEMMIRLTEELTQEQLAWRPSQAPPPPPAGFHLWHAARWADYLQSRIPGVTPELGSLLGPGVEISEAQGMVRQWGLDPGALGFAGTGMGMEDQVSESLVLPGREELLAYARQAFAAASRAVGAIDDTQHAQTCIDMFDRENTVGASIMGYLTHINRHVGMVEALRGVLGIKGIA